MPLLGSQRSMGTMLRALVYNSSIGSLMLRRGQAPNLGWHHSHLFYGLLYLKRAALLCLTSLTHESGNTWIESGQTLLLYLDEVMRGLARLARKTVLLSLILAVKSRYLPLLW